MGQYHIDVGQFFLVMKVCRAEWYENEHTIKYPYSSNIKKWKILIIESCMASKKYDTTNTSWNLHID